MLITKTRFAAVVLFVFLTSLIRADETLKLTSPIEKQVTQRDKNDRGVVTIAGRIDGKVDVVEAKAELPENSSRGKAVGWTALTTKPNIDAGKFKGKLTLNAGGWYEIHVRARQGKKVLAESKVIHVGIGDVFITAGQSNSANYGRPKQTAKDDRVVYFNGKEFVPARDPIPGGSGGGGSPWPILGDLIVKSQNVPVCFRSATLTWTEVKNWLPEKKRLYDNLVKCSRAFGKNGVRAVLWHQGESDSLAKTSSEDYFDRLKTIIEQLNKDAGYSIPWFVAQASFHPGSKPPEEKEVASGQQLLWKRRTALKGPVTDDLLGKKYRSDGVHFNQLGLATHAQRWFESLSAVYHWN